MKVTFTADRNCLHAALPAPAHTGHIAKIHEARGTLPRETELIMIVTAGSRHLLGHKEPAAAIVTSRSVFFGAHCPQQCCFLIAHSANSCKHFYCIFSELNTTNEILLFRPTARSEVWQTAPCYALYQMIGGC